MNVLAEPIRAAHSQELNTAELIYRVRPKQGEAPLNSLGRGGPGDATTSSGPFRYLEIR